jgi:flagellar biosynthesis protein FliQ
MSIFAFLKLGKSGLGKIVTTRLIVFSFVVGLVLNILVSSEGIHPILLTFFPAAVLITNYVESIKRENTQEIILIFSIFVPFMVFLTTLIAK